MDQLILGQADRAGEQDRDDDGAGVERQDVLEPVDGELLWGSTSSTGCFA
ncbi:hypothetical protein [Flexivirga alba]|uniref:Uncharacterized protein n=1 Tax=Flexivirga alba TaxID=702742 RepID=A0ABW2AHL6_9MICO